MRVRFINTDLKKINKLEIAVVLEDLLFSSGLQIIGIDHDQPKMHIKSYKIIYQKSPNFINDIKVNFRIIKN